jgi:hypothetical protein
MIIAPLLALSLPPLVASTCSSAVNKLNVFVIIFKAKISINALEDNVIKKPNKV